MSLLDCRRCTAVIFCGGQATRLRPLLGSRSKALVEIGSELYLISLLKWLKRQGIIDVVLCVSTFTPDIGMTIGNGGQLGLSVRYSTDDGMGENGGALWKATTLFLAEQIICINGDTILDVCLQRVLHAHLASGLLGTIVVSSRSDQPHPGAVVLSSQDRVMGFFEREQDAGAIQLSSQGGRLRSNAGFSIFDTKRLLEAWPIVYRSGKLEQGLFPYLVSRGQLNAYDNAERFLLDIGIPQRLDQARGRERFLRRFFLA